MRSRMRGNPRSGCRGHRRVSRREFFYVGAIGALGLTLGDTFRLRAFGEQKQYDSIEGPAKSVIQIFLPGGLAAQESFDPKPHAPVEYRGPIGSIPTALAGVRYSELLPQTAKISDKITVVRSMSHNEAAHERGVHSMFTGYRPSPALQYPSLGSVVSHEFGPRRDLPPYICIPNVPNEFAGSGYLSSSYGPFGLGSDPARKNFRVRDLSLPEGITPKRFERRKSLLEAVDAHFRELETSDALDSMDQFYRRAYSLIASPSARAAFDLGQEPDAVKDRYGRNEPGQRMLLARRLVESGARFVSLSYGGWDHHDNIADGVRRQLPPFDVAYATLIRDLEERGLLDSTLVLLTTEFGRTPKINDTGGRDHYPKVFSIALAGGGVRKGHVFGSSNATSTEVEEDPLSIQDLSATIYHQLGIVADKELMAPGDRPIEIVDGGKVVEGLLA
ncbi:MAG: DUF1501 domain-containing protein [Planctomycetota bacterium]